MVFWSGLREHDEFADLQAKESPGDHKPFNRMLVRLKKEIISMGVAEIDPVSIPVPKISARQLKQWLDEGRDITLLDTRNDYEIGLGTFENAISVGIDHFRQFPDAVKSLPPETPQATDRHVLHRRHSMRESRSVDATRRF